MRSGIFSYQNCRRRLFLYGSHGTSIRRTGRRRKNEHAPDADCRPVDRFLSPGINDRFIQSANRTVFLSVFFP